MLDLAVFIHEIHHDESNDRIINQRNGELYGIMIDYYCDGSIEWLRHWNTVKKIEIRNPY